MNELTTYQQNLPDTIEDVAHFLLIASKRATALRIVGRSQTKTEQITGLGFAPKQKEYKLCK